MSSDKQSGKQLQRPQLPLPTFIPPPQEAVYDTSEGYDPNHSTDAHNHTSDTTPVLEVPQDPNLSRSMSRRRSSRRFLRSTGDDALTATRSSLSRKNSAWSHATSRTGRDNIEFDKFLALHTRGGVSANAPANYPVLDDIADASIADGAEFVPWTEVDRMQVPMKQDIDAKENLAREGSIDIEAGHGVRPRANSDWSGVTQAITRRMVRSATVAAPRDLYSTFGNSDQDFFKSISIKESFFSADRLFVGNQVLRYSPTDLSRLGCLFSMTGTVFSTKFMYIQCALVILYMHVVAAVVWLLYLYFYHGEDEGSQLVAKDMDVYKFDVLFGFFITLLSFVLSYQVNTTLTRWWTVRTLGEDGFQNAFNSICMLLGLRVKFPTPEDDEVKARVLRYGLLAHQLIFMQARGITDLSELRKLNLLTEEEEEVIADRPAKALLAWSWVVGSALQLAEEKMTNKDVGIVVSQGILGRAAIHNIFTFIDTQLPFAYTHIVCLMVKVFLLVSATNFGVRTGLAVIRYLYADKAGAQLNASVVNENFFLWVWIAGITQLIIYSLFYQGLLDLQEMLSNPFGKDRVDFPFLAYQYFLRHDCISMLESGSELRELNGIMPPKQKDPKPSLQEVLKELGMEDQMGFFLRHSLTPELLKDIPYDLLRELGMDGISAHKVARYFKSKETAGDKKAKKKKD